MFPIGLQCTGHQAVFGFHCPITALGLFDLVAGRFDLQAPIGPFYTGLLAAFAWAFGVGVVIFVAVSIQLGGVTLDSLESDPTASLLIMAGIYAAIFLAFFPAVPARAALEYAPEYILRRRF